MPNSNIKISINIQTATGQKKKCIIDGIIVSRTLMKAVRDTKIKMGYEIVSDHYLVETKIVFTRDRKKVQQCSER